MQSSGSKDADMVDSPSYLGGRGRGALLRQVPLQGQQSCSVTEQIIEAFFAQGLTLEQASAMHFTVLLRKLHEEQLLKVMVKTVEHVFFLSCSRARYTVDMNLNIKWKLQDKKKITMSVRHTLQLIFRAQKELKNEGPQVEQTLLKFKCYRECLQHRLLLIRGEEVLCAFKEEA
eukprot:1164166-Rhodomonas_salina.2